MLDNPDLYLAALHNDATGKTVSNRGALAWVALQSMGNVHEAEKGVYMYVRARTSGTKT